MENIIRLDKTGNFTVVSNCIFNYNLSAKALGVLIRMLSRPDNWKFYVKELMKSCKLGRHAINSAMNELIKGGFINRVQLRNADGTFNGCNYIIYESPHIKFNDVNISKPKNKINNKLKKKNKCNIPKKCINKLKNKINNIIGGNILDHGITELLSNSSIKNINYYLDNWNKFKNISKDNVSGWFIKCVINKYQVPISHTAKPIQSQNYEQRKYDDNFFNSLYDNIEPGVDIVNMKYDNPIDDDDEYKYYDNLNKL